MGNPGPGAPGVPMNQFACFSLRLALAGTVMAFMVPFLMTIEATANVLMMLAYFSVLPAFLRRLGITRCDPKTASNYKGRYK